ncbi:MAG: 4-hydroxy-3-methylbut-2-enyl diphosphate reductase [Desulfuromonas sp.]|nr:MAG: 4-hydroxy-3-methylbut-2-enyl diphosphate reductase [Desulfuromonas sp.]
MKVLLAQSAGFCFGVKRATKMAFESAHEHDRICSLGPIIHSPQLVKKLEELGVEVVKDVEGVPKDAAVIVRSHGITFDELQQLTDCGLEIIDATCPFVKNAQDYAAQLSKEGYTLLIVGEREHPEVQGILSFARDGDVVVVADLAQAEALPRRRRIGIVAQTTQSLSNLQEVVDICLHKCYEMRVFNTICDATKVRQEEAREIAKKSDVVLVLGGYNSANTRRLAEICEEIQPHTHHIETADEIHDDWFSSAQTVAITAGASTPQWIIDEAVKRVEGISQ